MNRKVHVRFGGGRRKSADRISQQLGGGLPKRCYRWGFDSTLESPANRLRRWIVGLGVACEN
jgi:hypothetical protein